MEVAQLDTFSSRSTVASLASKTRGQMTKARHFFSTAPLQSV